MKKYLIFFAAMLLGITACDKKHKTPEEYFSFDANGVHYEYPQEETPTTLFGGGYNTLGAGPSSGNLGYQIYAFTQKNPVASGEFRFIFSNNNLPTQDTILLSQIGAMVEVSSFLWVSASYNTDNLHTGTIIFTERSSNKLTGSFEFTAINENNGELLNVTKGKFSIIPSN